MSASAWNAWDDIQANAADLNSTSMSCLWEMPSLVSAAIIAAAYTHLSKSLGADVTALIARETQVPSKVCGVGMFVYEINTCTLFLHVCAF